MFIKVKDTLVELLHEEPIAECGHGLMAAIGIALLLAFLVAVWLS